MLDAEGGKLPPLTPTGTGSLEKHSPPLDAHKESSGGFPWSCYTGTLANAIDVFPDKSAVAAFGFQVAAT